MGKIPKWAKNILDQDLKNTIRRKFNETDDEFRKRVLKKSKEMKDG